MEALGEVNSQFDIKRDCDSQLESGDVCGAPGPRGQDPGAAGQGEERHRGPHQLHALQVGTVTQSGLS